MKSNEIMWVSRMNFEKMTVSKIIGIMTVNSPGDRYEKMTSRTWYGLSFCESGQITYTVDGKDFVSKPGTVIYHPKGSTYTIRGDKKGVFYVINFDCAGDAADEFAAIECENQLIKTVLKMKELDFFRENRNKVMSLLYELFYMLDSKNVAEAGVLTPAVSYLEKNYADVEISNGMLADMCNISEVYFRKLFAETFGKSPKQYIIEMRVNKAKQLLAEGVYKINAIAEKCGFSNPYHFCRTFREKTGKTPGEYMKTHRVYMI